MKLTTEIALVYLAIVSVISVIVTVYDKRSSKIDGHRRIPERSLIFLAALGGSVAMLVTMLFIHHKTKHAKFMIGLPIIIVLQYAVFYCIVTYI